MLNAKPDLQRREEYWWKNDSQEDVKFIDKIKLGKRMKKIFPEQSREFLI